MRSTALGRTDGSFGSWTCEDGAVKTSIVGLALALVVTLAPAATAAPQAEGTTAKASLYAHVLDTGNRRIQLLRRTCTNPSEQHGCVPIVFTSDTRSRERLTDRSCGLVSDVVTRASSGCLAPCASGTAELRSAHPGANRAHSAASAATPIGSVGRTTSGTTPAGPAPSAVPTEPAAISARRLERDESSLRIVGSGYDNAHTWFRAASSEGGVQRW